MQVVVLSAIAVGLGWRPAASGLLPGLLVLLLGSATFVSLALLLAGTLRSEAVLALANLIWLVLVGGGALVVPVSSMPAGLSHVASVLPSGALGEAARAAFADGRLALGPVLVLLAWGVAGALAAVRWFRWD
ncbi:hypothetical protein GCM10025868_02410 [Angustibacter aerolatus]|uniref:ABC-2 type transporter domain-containing protein n=1 Tax=Angustibacter aerolatus TaxID=1162965 RepID=A0ABQ6JBL2_9ACTN|nr:hypothetical protein GCM10025868_02410 [Angustibacter aerolatus]